MSKVILRMQKICKSFAGVMALQDVDFSLLEGEVHALVGGNGAGKSTLMKVMIGVYGKDSGEITLENQPVENELEEGGTRKSISMIFQELSLVQSMSVAENIFLGDEVIKGLFLDKQLMLQTAQVILDKLGIKIDPKIKVKELSVGVSQMIEIAKAIRREAKILIFDEPTASLSESETAQLFELIRELKAQGMSIVYISHRMHEIMQIADRITVLKDGKVVLNEKVSNTKLEKIVSYFGDEGSSSNMLTWKTRAYSSEDILTVRNLTVNQNIANLSFEVKKGEILGIAGLMGSGRTEILEALFGIGPKTAGIIQLDGVTTAITNAKEGMEAGFALVPEDRRKQGLVLSHTVKQNNILPVLQQLIKYQIIVDEQASKHLTEKNIAELNVKSPGIETTINLLSGGNQQKVVLSKWLNTQPKVMLLDEPTAGVDIGAKSEIIDIIRDYADKGNGVVFVSSEVPELLAVCDRILILAAGKIVKEMRREDIVSEEELQHAIQAG